MTTINAQTGEVMGQAQPATQSGESNPYNTYVSNMGNLLAYITSASSAGNAGIQQNIEGLKRGQASLATPNGVTMPGGAPQQDNPLNAILSMEPGSVRSGTESTLGSLMSPTILSNQGQAQVAEQNSTNLTNETSAQIDAYKAMNQVGRYSSGVFPGTTTQFTYDTATGQYSDQYGNPITPPKGMTPPNGDPLVNGIDYTAYNGGVDPDYTHKMQSATSTLQSAMPSGFDVGIADNLLKAHKSPLTPQMISTAASTYGVNPIDLMAQTGLESVYGTSTVAKEDNNPGGIKWANQPHATMGSPASDGGNYAKFDNLQDGLYAQAKLISQNTPGSKNSTLSTSGGTQTNVNPLVQQLATQVANGTSGMSYDTAMSQITSAFPQYGALIANQLLPAIQKINPKFNINQSNAQASAQASNTKLAGDTSALVDATNSKLDLLPDAFDALPIGLQSGSELVQDYMRGFTSLTGINKTAADNYYRILSDARASANSVLTTAASLGVVTGGKTADQLLPDTMNRKGLQTAISTIKDLEEKTKIALANLANASGGSNGSVPQGNTNTAGLNTTSQSILSKYGIK